MKIHKFFAPIGGLFLAVVLVTDGVFEDQVLPTWLVLLLVVVGAALFVAGVYYLQRERGAVADERFILHRLKSSRFGLVFGMIALLALVFYNILVKEVLPWDLVIVTASITVGKVAAMIYFRITG